MQGTARVITKRESPENFESIFRELEKKAVPLHEK